MDHIPRPQKPVHPPLQIPYYVTDGLIYRNERFSNFLTEKGFPSVPVAANLFENRTLPDVLGILQAWALFALIHETAALLGVQTNPEDFIAKSVDGTSHISTVKLPRILHQWSWTVPEPESLTRLQGISMYILEVNRVLIAVREAGGHLFAQGRLTSDEYRELNALLLSITCVAETLEAPVMHSLGFRTIQAHLCPLLLERYRASGWCLHRISALRPGIAYTSAHFFDSDLDRRESDQDHAPCWDSDTCLVFSKIVKEYATVHTEDCSPATCGNWRVEGDQTLQLEDTILRHRIPAIRVTQDQEAKLKVEMCQFGAQQDPESTVQYNIVQNYVAISHVWLDGLGNSEENGLPICQLVRLQTLANRSLPEYEGPVAYWIDTICVPKDHTIRGLAIGAMRHVYHGANVVLVLDRYLQRLTTSSQLEEISQTILTCNWRLRLWTLHEGILAQRLLLQLSDGVVDDGQLFSRYLLQTFEADVSLPKADHLIREEVLSRKMSSDFLSLTGWITLTTGLTIFSQNVEIDQVLQQIIVLLTGRSTTRQEDEVICLSTLVGQNADYYYNLSEIHTERLKAFLLSLKKVPLGLVFRSGPRIDEDGYRWMPFTFLKTDKWQPEFPSVPEPAIPCSLGLKFRLRGYNIIVAADQATKTVSRSLSVGISNGSTNCYYAAFVDKQDRSPALWPHYADRNLIIIPSKALTAEGGDIRTILVSFIREEDTMHICRFEALMDLIPHEDLDPQQHRGRATMDPLSVDQEWCVG